MTKHIFPRISESIIRNLVKPFKEDYGKMYCASRYIRVAQRQREDNQKEMEVILKRDYISKEDLELKTCGLCFKDYMVRNPHPDAGKPNELLKVGAVYVCIPCSQKAKHNWAERATELEDKIERDYISKQSIKDSRDAIVEILNQPRWGESGFSCTRMSKSDQIIKLLVGEV